MTEYALYVESGPRKRTTMVHVLDLLGCIAQGPTTDEALEVTPEAIRTYLRFLRRHGEAVDPEAPFTTRVAEHVTEGPWIGYGDPAPGFRPDFQPLSVDELHLYLHRLAGMREEMLQLVGNLPPDRLLAGPEKGRSIYHILEHVAGAHSAYLRYAVGKVDGLSEAYKAIERSPEDAPAALARLWEISSDRLRVMADDERVRQVPHGQMTWTARRGFRRMLEHEWEHLREIQRRLGGE